MEKVIHWHHGNQPTENCTKPFAWVNIFGDILHNLIDGMLIAASFFISIPVGIATTIAIALHEIPHELTHVGILIHAGLNTKKAILINVISGLSSVFGAIIVLVIGAGAAGFTDYFLPIAAGGFIYIAGSDLLPELHQEIRWRQSISHFFGILLGVTFVALILLIE